MKRQNIFNWILKIITAASLTLVLWGYYKYLPQEIQKSKEVGLQEGRNQVYYALIDVSNAQRNLDSAMQGKKRGALVILCEYELEKEKARLAKYMGHPRETFYPWTVKYNSTEEYRYPEDWYHHLKIDQQTNKGFSW
jgi:hypothetical protein